MQTKGMLRRLCADKQAVTASEYALLAGALVTAAILSASYISGPVVAMFIALAGVF